MHFIHFCLVLVLLPRNIMDSSFVFVNCAAEKYVAKKRKLIDFSSTSEISSCSVNDNSKLYRDPWGKEFNLYDPEDGWNEEKRQFYLKRSKQNLLQSKRMPAYTQNGYAKMKIPSQLYELINEAKVGSKIVTEHCNDVLQNCERVKEDGTMEWKNNTQLLLIKQSSYYSLIETEILLSLRPILESWSGQKLSKDHVAYGIRRYLRGAYFMSHVDRLPTHIISAILQIDQKVDTQWPLTVIDHNGRKDKIFLEKGEMVLYESAKVMHGRQFYLDGDYYDNLFIHFTIKKDYKKFQAINDYVWSKEEPKSYLKIY